MEVAGQSLMAVGLGLGLAAACGFRVFVPLLALSVASRMHYVPLASGFEWVDSDMALIAFGVATVIEVLAYYIPWLDHALDVAATPAAVAAGVITSASVLVDLPPLVRWSVAVIGGGGAAGLVQSGTVLLRLKSAAFTGGLGNPLVATLELAGSAIASVLAIVLPLVALVLVTIVCAIVIVGVRAGRRAFARQPTA